MTVAYDPTLLPADSESERCAAHAERIELDPGGSALWVDELIVVDVSLPWPKPVWAKDGFTAIPELVMDAGEQGRRVRVLAAVPLDDGISRVVTHRLDGQAQFARAEHHVDADQVAGLLETMLTAGIDASPHTVAFADPVRELLLCTQGSHDVCCGSRGASMFADLLAVDPSFVIRRVSHTGGHRMAPTGMTLPDGRMWGMVTVDEMVSILRAEVDPAAVTDRCRGWIGVPDGAEQVAERAVMAEVNDWEFDAVARSTAVVIDGDTTYIEVTVEADVWRVEVQAGRAVPTIACGKPGGLPAKPGAEWRVVSVSRAE
jgi:hypothetical protein